LRVGSTKGTNALLELKGAKTAFLVSKGFKDLLVIGNQARPDIFAMKIERPEPLYALVEEISEIIDANGEILQAIDTRTIDELVQKLKVAEIESIAICLKNSYRNPVHEIALKEALSPHFEFIHISTELSSQIKFQQRAETTVVNAYLSPVIHRYLSNIASKVGEGNMKVMTSAGSLVRYDAFHPKDSLFSGPAGGVVGASKVAQKAGIHQFIAFDMGGTSTDVARYDHELEYQFIQKIGNAQIFSPALAIETVAAGGGSICAYDGYKLSVGPKVQAHGQVRLLWRWWPLAITDVNLLLGRLDSTQFGIPVFVDGAKKRLEEILSSIENNTGTRPQAEEILEGFRAIANEKMAETVRKISIAKGYATTDYALVAFGGAGGLHVCGIAELLGISKILLPLDAGLLSAYGISQAQVERFAEASVLEIYDENLDKELDKKYQDLATKAMIELKKDGIEPHQSYIKHRYIYLRLKGQDASLEIEWEGFEKSIQTFEEKYRQIYGHWTENRAIEVENIRLIAAQKQDTFEEKSRVVLTKKQAIPHIRYKLGWMDSGKKFQFFYVNN
jgi:5-oxoprolinase (ATP-hydrolysing)